MDNNIEYISNESKKANQGMKKKSYIKEVAEMTGVSQALVEDVLNAFTDVAQREMLVRGVFNWPGLPTVLRRKRERVLRYQKDIDKTLLYPETSCLYAKVPCMVKKMHREMFRAQNNRINGTTMENWWEPYVYCDGDWREKKDQDE